MPRTFRAALSGLLLLLLAACTSGTSTGGGGNGPQQPTVVLQDDVEVLDQQSRSSLESFHLDSLTGEGELRFQAGDPALDSLEPGTVLASEPVPGLAPHGFLQKVVSTRTEGGQVVVVTQQATLLETFEEAHIRLNEVLEPEDVVEAKALYQGVSFSDSSSGFRPLASTDFAFTVSFDEVLVDGDGDESTTDDQLQVDGSFNFDATASASIDIDCCEDLVFPYLDLFESKIELTEAVDVSVSGQLAAGFSESFEVARYSFGNFTVMAGPVPVVFVLDMVVSVGANGQFEARLEAGAVQNTSVTVGGRYTDAGGWKDLTSFDSDFDFTTPQITAAASARAFLRPRVNIKIYGLAGPYAYAEAFVATDAEMYRDPFWRFSAGIDFGIGFVIDLPVVGKLAEWDTTIAGFDETLEESGNGAPVIDMDLPTVVPAGDSITLTAYAEDREDGPFCCTFSWSSDVDGHLGDQNEFDHTLTPGPNTITLTIADSDGASTTESVVVYAASLTIEQPIGSFRLTDGLPLQATLTGVPPSSNPVIEWSYRDSDAGEVSIPRTTGSGEVARHYDVECGSGLQVYARSSFAGGQTLQERSEVECIPPQEAYYFEADYSMGGNVSDQGQVLTKLTQLQVGDDVNDHAWRGYIHFNLANLPAGAQIADATLNLNLSMVGEPFADLFELQILEVDYGGSLDSTDFNAPGRAGLTTVASYPGSGSHGFDVSTAVQNSVDRGFVQFMLYFRHGTTSDGESDQVKVAYEPEPGTSLIPSLDVTVQNY